MRDLNYQLKQLCIHNRDGSYKTQTDRANMLNLIANQLHELGYRRMSAASLKPKHVEALVSQWQKQGLSAGTLKNRMNCLRWWAAKVNRRNVIARSNEYYGIAKREYVTKQSKACSIDQHDLQRVQDRYVRMSLELQREFGLRREEAIKFRPSYADHGDRIVLKPSWTKGGKGRVVPVRSQNQREVLDRAAKLAGSGSLIPAALSYKQQVRIYERQTANAGLSKMHGLRHAYAQRRYQELTGWPAPAAGGPRVASMSSRQLGIDRRARMIVSKELGHERIQVVAVYLAT